MPTGHRSLSIPTCQICGLKGHVALNCTRRSNFAYQGSHPPASLTALIAQSNGGYNSGLQQSHLSFPGGFHLSNGASSSSGSSFAGYSVLPTGASNSSNSHINNEVWIGDSGATHPMTSDLRNLTIAQQYMLLITRLPLIMD